MNTKQYNNLSFLLTKADGATLELGGSQYPIVKSNTLFNNLLTFKNSTDGREIEIEVYINNASEIAQFGDFFEMSDTNEKYSLQIYFNNNIYNATVYTTDEPFQINQLEDLYGTKTKPTTSIKITLYMDTPFFYSNVSYTKNIGAQNEAKIKYPLTNRLNANKEFIVAYTSELVPHIINNVGNEDNGVVITIRNSTILVNPKIKNETTGMEMGFNMAVNINSTIVINTINKTVYVNNEYQSNVKNLFDKWLILIEGVNIISFEADTGAENSTIELSYFDKFRNLI